MSDARSTKFRWTRALGPVGLGASLLWGVAGAAHAQETVADRLNTMEAQLQLLQKQSALNQARANAAGGEATGLPKILAIAGFEDSLGAKLLLANGTVATVREGEVIRSNLSVAAITPKAVMVKVGAGKTAKTLALEFIAGAATPGGGGGFGVGAPMPVPLELLPPLPRVNVAPNREPTRNTAQATAAQKTGPAAPAVVAAPPAPAIPAAPAAPAPGAAAPPQPGAQAGNAGGLPISPAAPPPAR